MGIQVLVRVRGVRFYSNIRSTQAVCMQDDFDKAAEEAKTLPDQTSNDDKLILYGLFKQGTVGDCNTCKVTG